MSARNPGLEARGGCPGSEGKCWLAAPGWKPGVVVRARRVSVGSLPRAEARGGCPARRVSVGSLRWAEARGGCHTPSSRSGGISGIPPLRAATIPA